MQYNQAQKQMLHRHLLYVFLGLCGLILLTDFKTLCLPHAQTFYTEIIYTENVY
jgi:hypothetical protein